MPQWWGGFLEWMKDNQIGDLSGLVGIIISIFGFMGAIFGSFRARSAAERAEQASNEVKESIRLFETVSDFTSVIHVLEEIKRIHRSDQWILLPDRYSLIRKMLISMLSRQQFSVDQAATINSAISNLSKMELTVEKALSTNAKVKTMTFNTILLNDIDSLLKVLAELKSTSIGV